MRLVKTFYDEPWSYCSSCSSSSLSSSSSSSELSFSELVITFMPDLGLGFNPPYDWSSEFDGSWMEDEARDSLLFWLSWFCLIEFKTDVLPCDWMTYDPNFAFFLVFVVFFLSAWVANSTASVWLPLSSVSWSAIDECPFLSGLRAADFLSTVVPARSSFLTLYCSSVILCWSSLCFFIVSCFYWTFAMRSFEIFYSSAFTSSLCSFDVFSTSIWWLSLRFVISASLSVS